jgi:glutathione synthase/RimK-type ligase-like ATP-grasp enzyme
MVTALVDALARRNQVSRTLAPMVDMATTLGPMEVVRQRRYARRLPRDASSVAAYQRIWTRAAAEIGAEVVELGHGYLSIRLGGHSTLTWLQEVQLDDMVLLRLAADKPIVHRLLTAAGISVPPYLEVSPDTLDSALPFLAAAPTGCVVKPAAGTGVGSGVTGGVRNRRDLHRAAARVASFGDRILVERFLPGAMYRMTILDGVVLGVVRRGTPTIRADGRHSVAALVAAENSRRFADPDEFGPSWLELDLDCVLSLVAQGLTTRSVPAAGSDVRVKFATNQNARAENESVPVAACAAIADLACRAAAVVGLRFTGVDVLATDAADAEGAVVLEVNGTPGLKLHGNVHNEDLPGEQAAARIGVPVLQAALGEVAARADRATAQGRYP